MNNDLEGKHKFETFLNQKQVNDYKFTEYIYDRLDCFYKLKDNTIAVEIKNRDYKFESFPDYIMECAKYKAMKDAINNNEATHAQMIYFFGNTMYIFNFTKITRLFKKGIIKPIYSNLPNSTENYTHNLNKQVFYLPKQYAYKYRLVDNKWTLISKPYAH